NKGGMMPETKKPCPGCKRAIRRDADKVCGDCQELLDIGKKVLKARNKERDVLTVVLPWASHCLPYIQTPNLKGADEARGDFQKSFFELLKRLDQGYREKAGNIYWGFRGNDYSSGEQIHMTQPDIDLMKILLDSAQRLCKLNYADGRDDGQNFVVRL